MITKNQLSNLTELQQKLLSFYKDYQKKNKTYPTVTIAAKHFKVTRQAITIRAKGLQKQGYFTYLYGGMFIPTSKK